MKIHHFKLVVVNHLDGTTYYQRPYYERRNVGESRVMFRYNEKHPTPPKRAECVRSCYTFFGKPSLRGTSLRRAYVARGEIASSRPRSFINEKRRAARYTRRIVRQMITAGIDPADYRRGVSSWQL